MRLNEYSSKQKVIGGYESHRQVLGAAVGGTLLPAVGLETSLYRDPVWEGALSAGRPRRTGGKGVL